MRSGPAAMLDAPVIGTHNQPSPVSFGNPIITFNNVRRSVVMNMRNLLSIVSLAFAWPGAALAQDAVKTDPSHYTVVLENASVRFLKINYAAGGKSIMHSHPD